MQLVKKIIIPIFIALIIISSTPINSSAISSKVETSSVSESVRSQQKVETLESFEKRSLEAFHIDPMDGSFAVACASLPFTNSSIGDRKEIAVYANDGTLKYAVAVEVTGDIALYLNQGVLNVISKKGQLLFLFNDKGEYIDVKKITPNTREEYDFLDTNVYPKTKKINDVTYTLEDSTIGITPSFKVLRATYPNGESEILYESEENITLYKDGFFIVFFGSFLISITIFLIEKRRK